MQTTVQNYMDIGVAGQLVDLNNAQIISKANYSKQLDKVTITADDTTTTVTINGTAFTFTETGASENKAYIANYLTGEINAGSEPVTAYYSSGNDYLTVESNTPGTAMTVVGTANCTVVAQIANAAAIGFGLGVVQDEMSDDKTRVPIVAADITTVGKFLGITINPNIQSFDITGNIMAPANGYTLESSMGLVRKGRIYVSPETAVIPGQQVYCRFTISGSTVLGGLRNDDDSSKAAAIPTAYFRTSCAASGICILEINLV
jgi:hypothetical protein